MNLPKQIQCSCSTANALTAMIYIPKESKEPQALAQFKKQESNPTNEGWKANYNTLNKATKDAIRQQLYDGQGGICCYCMGKLDISHCKIEHLLPQEHFPYLALSYSNLYLACKGEDPSIDKKGKNIFHCDTSKGASLIPPYIQRRDCHTLLKYRRNGRIESKSEKDKILTATLDLLGLNRSHTCIKGRKAVFDTFLKEVAKNIHNLEEAHNLHQRLQATPRPYIGVMLYLLESRIIPKYQQSKGEHGHS